MTIPTKYAQPSAPLVNYDFADILSDVGYITLYGLDVEGGVKVLSRLAVVSDAESTNQAATGGLDSEVNFDFEFSLPQYIKGYLFVTVTFFAIASGAQNADCYLKIRPIHVDASSTETQMAAQIQTSTLGTTSPPQTVYERTTLRFQVEQLFKKGETLRIEVQTYSTLSTNAANGFYHDGGNRDYNQVDPTGQTCDSTIVVQVPIRLDI